MSAAVSPRCNVWRPAVDSDRDQPEINGSATEVRCRFAAGHPGQHSAYGITWDGEATSRAQTPVTVELSIRLEMTAEQVWPDGMPERFTADDVLAVILEAGSLRRFNEAWDGAVFDSGAEVGVHVDGRYARGWLW